MEQKLQPKPPRLYEIDLLRLLAALTVVVYGR